MWVQHLKIYNSWCLQAQPIRLSWDFPMKRSQSIDQTCAEFESKFASNIFLTFKIRKLVQFMLLGTNSEKNANHCSLKFVWIAPFLNGHFHSIFSSPKEQFLKTKDLPDTRLCVTRSTTTPKWSHWMTSEGHWQVKLDGFRACQPISWTLPSITSRRQKIQLSRRWKRRWSITTFLSWWKKAQEDCFVKELLPWKMSSCYHSFPALRHLISMNCWKVSQLNDLVHQKRTNTIPIGP